MTESQTEDQNSWVLDSVVGFLRGPVWGLTIQAFVEQKSVVFEPEEEDNEEVAQEYNKLFEEYKNLVDRLLSSHMSDLQISPEQFDEALSRASGLLAAKLRQLLFEQIWAANDYQIFVRFMTQRNIELQLQALEVLAHKYGMIYESFVPVGGNPNDMLNEELVVSEAIKRSMAEEGKERQLQEEDGKDNEVKDRTQVKDTEDNYGFDEMMKDNEEESVRALEETKRLLESEFQREEQRLQTAIQSALTLTDDPTENSLRRDLPKVKEDFIQYKPMEVKAEVMSSEVISEEKTNAKSTKQVVKRPELISESGLSPEELRKRSEYLRQQRDKLLKAKKQERDRQMARLQQQELMAKRPKSARAMRVITETDEVSDDDQSLAFRRSLAQRLKAEVVEQQKE